MHDKLIKDLLDAYDACDRDGDRAAILQAVDVIERLTIEIALLKRDRAFTRLVQLSEDLDLEQ